MTSQDTRLDILLAGYIHTYMIMYILQWLPDWVHAPTSPAVVEVNFVLTSYTFGESEDEVTLILAKRGVTTNPLSVTISAEDGTALGMSIVHINLHTNTQSHAHTHLHTITYTHTSAHNHIHTHICTQSHTHTHLHTITCTHTSAHNRIHTHLHHVHR